MSERERESQRRKIKNKKVKICLRFFVLGFRCDVMWSDVHFKCSG